MRSRRRLPHDLKPSIHVIGPVRLTLNYHSYVGPVAHDIRASRSGEPIFDVRTRSRSVHAA